jgi:uncharacterized protein YjbJ (UPF0337 family)
MSRLQKKAEGRTKQIVGQMIGDDQLVNEGKEEERRADKERRADSENVAEQPQNDGKKTE